MKRTFGIAVVLLGCVLMVAGIAYGMLRPTSVGIIGGADGPTAVYVLGGSPLPLIAVGLAVLVLGVWLVVIRKR